jgi:hypothetical protein
MMQPLFLLLANLGDLVVLFQTMCGMAGDNHSYRVGDAEGVRV